MDCLSCIYSQIDNVKDNYSNEVYKELCCHRYAPRMIHGTGTGFSSWRFPQVAPDDFCGEYKQKVETESG